LARNDVEICALSKLNTALRLIRKEIIGAYGEDVLIEIATKPSKRDNDEDERLQQLATAFNLRMKLRRRLLNRLSRRLYRVAYIMDNGDASPPMPPLYGDEVVRFKKDEDDDCRFISEEEVSKFVEGEEKKRQLREELGEKRRERRAELEQNLVKVEKEGDNAPAVTSGVDKFDEHTAVDFILRGDREDRPLLEQLKEYEVGYDKAISATADAKPTETNPIVNTTDPHEVNEEGEFVDKESDVDRINFTLIGLDRRPIPPRERSLDWKRWNKEMSTKIEEQVTFEDIGMQDKVFDLEKRLEDAKRKRQENQEEENSPRGKGKVLRRKSAFDSSVGVEGEEDVVENRGRGKELKKHKKEELEESGGENVAMEVEDKAESCDEDGNVEMEADKVKSEETDSPNDDKSKTDEEGNKGDEKQTDGKNAELSEIKPPKRHNRTFSLLPVPSFYTQDLRRVQLIQMELIHSSGRVNIEKLIDKAEAAYQEAFKKSMELQQAKAAAITDYQKTVQQHKAKVQEMKIRAEKDIANARLRWQTTQQTMNNFRSKFGSEALSIKLTASEILKEGAERIVLRTSPDETPIGTKITRHTARHAASSEDNIKLAVANTLGVVVDLVDRRYTQMCDRNPEFIPPIVETEHNTMYDARKKETLAQRFASIETHLKLRAQQVSKAFEDAEKARAAAWNDVTKFKSMMGGAAISKPKKNSKSNASSRSVAPVAAPRHAMYSQQANYQQQQQFVPVGRPIEIMQSAPMPVQRSQPIIPAQIAQMAGQGPVFNRAVVQSSSGAPNSAAAVVPVQQQNQPDGQGKMTQNGKYGYGDR
jgi:hypothetical protein